MNTPSVSVVASLVIAPQTFEWMTNDEVFAEYHSAADPFASQWAIVQNERSDRRAGFEPRSCHDGIESIDTMPNRWTY